MVASLSLNGVLSNTLITQIPGDEVYYYHNDHLGTPQNMTDSVGTVVWEADYLPFGEATVDDDPDGDQIIVTNNFRFPGQYYDAEMGLHYNWHRDYHPSIGRYIESDPIGLAGGTNVFIYALNNPTKLIDPLGKRGCGPGSGFWEWIIPDYPFGYNFSECCNQHDNCYGCEGKKQGKSRYDCDIAFCKCF